MNQPMISGRIREGVEEDLPQVLDLIRELAIFEKEPDAVQTTVQSMRRDGFGTSPAFGFFVAVDEKNEIVGLALYYWRYSTWKGRRLYLEDLIVTENARGQGYGKALFDRTIAFAIEQNCTGLVWQVLDWNEPAIAFYKSYGAELDAAWTNCCLDRTQLEKLQS